MEIGITQLIRLSNKILTNSGFSVNEAKIITHVLLAAEISGKQSQGFIKLVSNPNIVKTNLQTSEVKKQTKASLLIDGHNNNGILVADQATQLLLPMIKKCGIAIVGTNNTRTSVGMLGYYTSKIAAAGFIGIAMAGSPAFVSFSGGRENLLGTNPLSVAIPHPSTPIVLDMATSAMTMYEVLKASLEKRTLPQGVGIDREGKETTNPKSIMEGGSILPFNNSYKASGLSFIVEILAGPFLGASFFDREKTGDHGNLFIGINPYLFVSKKQFDENITTMIKRIKSSKSAKEIRYPGEQSYLIKNKHLKDGKISISSDLYQALQKKATQITKN